MITRLIFLVIISIVCFSCNNTSKADPCNVMCDNCMGIEQCEQCYENCYNSIDDK